MKEETMDFSFYSHPPEQSGRARLTINALAPLSMVSSQPGSYFRSELAPTNAMLYGLLENALGWHFHDSFRRSLLKNLAQKARKQHKKDSTYQNHAWLTGKGSRSQSGYLSLLQNHVSFQPTQLPKVALAYDDLWSTLLRDTGQNFIGGSRHYDYTLEALINRLRSDDPSERVDIGERANVHVRVSLEEAKNIRGASIHFHSVRDAFPMYYVSPRKRAYVVPDGPYIFDVYYTPTLATLLATAIEKPEAPLYLGSNDGWVDVKWEPYD